MGAFAAAKFASTLGIPFQHLDGTAFRPNQRAGRLAHGPAPRFAYAGINLAVVTLGGAVAINSVVFNNPGGEAGIARPGGSPSPKIFGWSLNSNTHPERFAGAAAIILAVMYLPRMVRRSVRGDSDGSCSPFPRQMKRSAAGTGVDVRATGKLGAFALAAFMAGVAGALYAYQNTNITFDAFLAHRGDLLLREPENLSSRGSPSLGGGLLVWLLASGGIM